MKSKLKASNSVEEKVLAYIEQNGSDSLIEKINSGNKTLEQCIKFVMNEAKNLAIKGCAIVDDSVVYGWAVHFFEEDSIKAESIAPVVASVQTVKKTTQTEIPKKFEKKLAAVSDSQISIFDMFWGQQ